MEDTDTSNGGESLSIDQAAAAYVKATSTPEVVTDQAEAEEHDESETTDDELQASDEDEGDETDGETAEEDQAEDGEDEPESEQGRFVADNARVRLPDGTFTTVAELKSGSLRNADYTRKTQEVAEQRRAVESQSERIKASEAQLQQQTEYVQELLRAIIPAAPDPKLLDTDPMGYIQQEAQHKQWSQHLAYLDQQRQQAAEARKAEAEGQQREVANREWNTLLEKAPEFRDQKRAQAFVQDSIKHGIETYGFTQAELREALGMDHRQILVLRDAIAWRKLQASKATVAKKVEGRPPVAKGGKRLNPSEHRARAANDALSRLKSSGSEADAVAAYLALKKG